MRPILVDHARRRVMRDWRLARGFWTPDSKRVAYQSDREKDLAVFWQPVDGGPAERLTKPDPGTSHTPESWSPDGETLLVASPKTLTCPCRRCPCGKRS